MLSFPRLQPQEKPKRLSGAGRGAAETLGNHLGIPNTGNPLPHFLHFHLCTEYGVTQLLLVSVMEDNPIEVRSTGYSELSTHIVLSVLVSSYLQIPTQG